MKKEIKFIESGYFLELSLTQDSKTFIQKADRETFNYAISSLIISAILNAAGQNLRTNLFLLLKKFIRDTEMEIRRFEKYLNSPQENGGRFNFTAQEVINPLPFNNIDLSCETYNFNYELITDTWWLEFDLCKIYFVIKESFETRNIKKEFPAFVTSIFEHNPKLYDLLGGRVEVFDPETIRRRFENLSKELVRRIPSDSFDHEETVRKIRRKKQPF